jgi:hypothetical protein
VRAIIKKTFEDVVTVEMNGNQIELPYIVHHSTHEDNPHLPDQYRAMLEDLKRTNPYYYTVYTQGKWGTAVVTGRFYQEFSQSIHTYKGNRYNPDIALHISFDFNVHPYVSISIWQIVGKQLTCIDLIAARDPDNRTDLACQLFLQGYGSHDAGLFVYGDPAGRHEDTRSELGANDFNIIRKELRPMHPQVMLLMKAPSVSMRGNFINAIFRDNEQGISIEINEKCTELINDLLFGKMASDGTKFKEKHKDKESGIQVEKHHHFSDNMDYLICKAFINEYNEFKRGFSTFDYSMPYKRNFKR